MALAIGGVLGMPPTPAHLTKVGEKGTKSGMFCHNSLGRNAVISSVFAIFCNLPVWNWIMKMFKSIAIYDSFVKVLFQSAADCFGPWTAAPCSKLLEKTVFCEHWLKRMLPRTARKHCK